MRAGIYKRVSITKQVVDGVSLEIQEERLKAYCVVQGWEIVDVYEDAGLSGKDTNRPGFQRMMKDAENKNIDVVVCYKLDRITRSVKDFHELAEKLDSWNVSLVSVTQNLDTSTPVGRLLRNILVDFANFEREMIIERSMDAKYNLAEKGQWLGGKTPYGYKVVNKKLVVDPDKAEIVKALYNEYMSGISIRGLMKQYNLPMSTVSVVLRNPVYTGYIGYSKTEQTKKGTKQRKDRSDWILSQGEHEAIISMELWEMVQERKKKRYLTPSSRSTTQIFEGLCFCECGNKMYYYFTIQKELCYQYYRCNSYNKAENGCKLSIKESHLEMRVISSLHELVTNKLKWERIEHKINKDNQTDHVKEIARLEKEYKKITSQISNLIKHMSNNVDISHLIAPEIKKLESELSIINKALAEKKQQQIKKASIDTMHKSLKNFISYWANASREQKRESSKIIIDRIQIGVKEIKIKLSDPDFPEIIC